MPTKREWLVSQGLAKPGRGKFSTAANKAADASGIVFDDPVPGAPAPVVQTTVTVEGNSETVKPKADPKETPYYTPSEFRFPEAEYIAYVVRDQKKVEVSLRECCNLCRVSLVNHACASPSIHGNLAVTIEKR